MIGPDPIDVVDGAVDAVDQGVLSSQTLHPNHNQQPWTNSPPVDQPGTKLAPGELLSGSVPADLSLVESLLRSHVVHENPIGSKDAASRGDRCSYSAGAAKGS